DIMAMRYPLLVVRADMSEADAYNYLKAFDETYDLYKNATSVMPRWTMQQSGVPPADAPFHPGAVKYLKEKGIWTDEYQAWNEARLKRLQALRAAWADTMKTGKDLPDDKF